MQTQLSARQLWGDTGFTANLYNCESDSMEMLPSSDFFSSEESSTSMCLSDFVGNTEPCLGNQDEPLWDPLGIPPLPTETSLPSEPLSFYTAPLDSKPPVTAAWSPVKPLKNPRASSSSSDSSSKPSSRQEDNCSSNPGTPPRTLAQTQAKNESTQVKALAQQIAGTSSTASTATNIRKTKRATTTRRKTAKTKTTRRRNGICGVRRPSKAVSERRRREELKNAFQRIRTLLPGEDAKTASKNALLILTYDYIVELQAELACKRQEIERLKQYSQPTSM